MSVFDFAHLGSTHSLRSFARVGSTMSVTPHDRPLGNRAWNHEVYTYRLRRAVEGLEEQLNVWESNRMFRRAVTCLRELWKIQGAVIGLGKQ